MFNQKSYINFVDGHNLLRNVTIEFLRYFEMIDFVEAFRIC